jgi:hypothetical protein
MLTKGIVAAVVALSIIAGPAFEVDPMRRTTGAWT